ncbi:MAG TPA: GNAT family N-acetyltransferase [Candidatus Binatia bacterium]|nr:GNAT family N-acetyltransferase [Candidatus Binatia bacterium]
MTSDNPILIRRAEPRDAAALGRYGAALVRAHHAFDAQRFLTPGPRIEDGYAHFLGTQLRGPDVVVFVAERAGTVVGYVYAGVEPQSWKELRDAAGFIHDVVVDPGARGLGIGTGLIEAAAAWLINRGVPRVMLWTAAKNEPAQRLFERLGFRRTMIEMTREAGAARIDESDQG